MGSLVNASLTSLTPPPPAAEPAGAVEPGSGGGGGGTGMPQDPAQRYMVAHAEYQAVFMRTHHFVMRGDGPLAFDMRHYVAIMAVGRHQCHVLLDFLKEEFLASGGEERWLDGLQHVPKKLSDLNELNKLMAHRPWLIGKTHIERLARGRDNWSLGELLQAITVLAHYHTLSSFVLGCSALDEADRSDAEPEPAVDDGGGGGTDGKDIPAGEDPVCGSPGAVAPVRQLMQKMRTLSEQRQSAGELTAEQKNVIYEAVDAGADSAELPAPRPPRQHDHLTRFVEDGEFAYEDFSRRGGGSSVPTFRVQDYSWEDHGFSLVNRLYSDVGVLLDDKFRTAYHLTYQTMGAYRAVDTRLFRRAVWRYIQCLYGIRHDDYDYAVVNQLLDRRLKAFVKTMCVYPERLSTSTSGTSSGTPSSSGGTTTSGTGTPTSGGTTASEPLQAGVMQGFQRSEKVHVAILCLEARLQSELLYALRAVMRYTT